MRSRKFRLQNKTRPAFQAKAKKDAASIGAKNKFQFFDSNEKKQFR